MRYLILLAVQALLAVASAASPLPHPDSTNDTTWHLFTSSDSMFSAVMPGKIREANEPKVIDGDEALLREVFSRSAFDIHDPPTYDYSVLNFSVPGGFKHRICSDSIAWIREALEPIADDAKTDPKCTFFESHFFPDANPPYLGVLQRFRDHASLRIRYFFHHGQLFSVQIRSLKDSTLTGADPRFFESIRFDPRIHLREVSFPDSGSSVRLPEIPDWQTKVEIGGDTIDRLIGRYHITTSGCTRIDFEAAYFDYPDSLIGTPKGYTPHNLLELEAKIDKDNGLAEDSGYLYERPVITKLPDRIRCARWVYSLGKPELSALVQWELIGHREYLLRMDFHGPRDAEVDRLVAEFFNSLKVRTSGSNARRVTGGRGEG